MPTAELILRGGRVVTLDPARPGAEALAVAGGRIVALGREVEVMARRGPGTRIIDMKGGVALPSLKDHHVHLLNVGFAVLNRERHEALFLDMSGTRSAEEVAERVKARAASQPPGSWILGTGWSQEAWADRTLPTHELLTHAAPDNPVLLARVDGHCGWANALALKKAGISRETPDPPGGEILRLPDGSPSGILLERASEPMLAIVPAPSDEVVTDSFRAAARALAAEGLTDIYDAGFLGFPGLVGMNAPFEHYFELLRRLDAREPLPLRVNLMIPAPSPFADKVRSRKELRAASPRLRITHIKLFADGALGSRGAALSEPYADNPKTRGVFRMTAEELADEVQRSLDAGLDVATHAIGDAAVERVLDVYGAILAKNKSVSPRRLRIEHLSHSSRADQQRAARLGIVLAVQPGFVYPGADGRIMEDARLGPERARDAYPWKRLEAMGAVLAGSSDDFTVPLHPLWNYYAAVTRKNPAGQPAGGWQPEERVSRPSALQMFTDFYEAGGERRAGRLEAGSPADLVVFSDDPLEVREPEILSLEVRATVAGGRVTFERKAD